MPCTQCSSLPFHNPDWQDPILHQASFADLCESAIRGCQVCALLRTALLEYCARVRSCSVDEADRYQRHLDQLAVNDYQSSGWGDTSSDDSVTSESTGYALFIRRLSKRLSHQQEGVVGLGYWRRAQRTSTFPDEVDCYIDVSSAPDSIARHKWNVMGRRLTPMADIALAKTWIHDCLTGHSKCRLDLSQSRMPSRLLDLHPHPSSTALDLRLVVNVHTHAPYIALSHCWGRSQPLRLLRSSYDEFQHTIIYKTLPRTFQDAVTATRALGVRYLWIDSLCIIQDSKEDWEEQCAETGRIYRCSFATIAGPAAADCSAGFLHPRPLMREASLTLTDGESRSELALGYLGVDMDLIFLAAEPNAPLSRRAWTFQERLLAQRILYFGTRGLYLECLTNVRIDSCHHPIESTIFNGAKLSKTRMEELKGRDECFGYWVSMIQTYSALALTKRMDRLPALAGMASEFSRITSTSPYLAGLWRDDLPRGLTWYVNVKSPASGVLSAEYIAPSWSWAAVDRSVLYVNNLSLEFHPDFDIADANATPSGLDPFGTVNGGHIDGSGRVRSLLVRCKSHPDSEPFKVLLVSGCQAALNHVQYVPDDSSAHIRSKHSAADVTEVFDEVLFLYLGSYAGKYSDLFAVALGIEQVPGIQSTYRRTGLAFWTVSWAYHLRRNNWAQDLPKFADCFQGVDKRQVRII